MTKWQPMSVRRGLKPAQPLVDGVPSYLYPSIERWIETYCGAHTPGGMSDERTMKLALAVQHPLSREPGGAYKMMRKFLQACERDENLTLDVVDAALSMGARSGRLAEILEAGGSAWMVRDDGAGLVERVDSSSLNAFKQTTSTSDIASSELQIAWNHAYGRNPDASDAWDHAIKAVETVLIPLVSPNNSKATLGSVLSEIEQNPARLSFGLQTSSKNLSNMDTLSAILRLMWPNPDRHGGPTGSSRTPTLVEAQSVVHTAITVVQFVRNGSLA